MKTPSAVSRRGFLRCAVVSSAAFFLAGCRREENEDAGNYYLRRKEEILNQARSSMSSVLSVLSGREGDVLARAITDETLFRFDRLLPDLPYIGGDRNELTGNLCQGALGMVFYQTMKERRRSAEVSGEMLYRAAEQWARSMPLSRFGARSADSEAAHQARRRSAERSQLRRYPADWVSTYVPGEDPSFDWGTDYSECGLCKLFTAHGTEEFTRYLCLLDFPFSQVMGTGLRRTTTLALGGARCDFRYAPGGDIRMEWTPAFLVRQAEEDQP